MSFVKRIRWAAAATILSCGVTFAQPAQQAGSTWATMPRMQLEQQFAGPLQDTTIQRWRDPTAGIICYVYLPFVAAHTAPTATGFVQYGPNGIGSISCVEAKQATTPVNASAPKTPAKTPAKTPPTPPAAPPG